MIDVLIQSVPWDKVGEATLAIIATLGLTAGIVWSAKKIWEYIVASRPDFAERVRKWYAQQRHKNIYRGFVFVMKAVRYGGRQIKCFALRNNGERVDTGASVHFTASEVPKNMPEEKEFEKALSALGIEA